MADDKNTLTPSTGVVVGGSSEPSTFNATTSEDVKNIKENKNINDTSKEVKPNKTDNNTVNSDTTIETFKIQEIIGDMIVIGFHGYRVALSNKNKNLGDSVEVEYSGTRQDFKVINYK